VCYSAQIQADYRRFVRQFGAQISLQAFRDLFWRRLSDPRVKIPKAMEAAFLTPTGGDSGRDGGGAGSKAGAGAGAGAGVGEDPRFAEIREAIARHRAAQATAWEQEVFKQKRRLADAERSLTVKTTKTALESRRIASEKIERTLGWLADLRREEPEDRDARIFPGHYVPVMVMESGQRVVKPMRYQCRPAGKPANVDARFPGTYNARRDNLEGFWKGVFGVTHGIAIISAFYENVTRPEGNVVLEFRPRPARDMLVACLWSHWKGPGEPDLLSFAAITDEPPPEIAAAGHDRCIIPIKPEYVDAWLSPNPRDLKAQYAILEDRDRPYYVHQLAA
jgi:putative SOS response-associated peptidase YedK